ncbi:collagenase-like [Anopheles funestus]|uniref:collagenase-like n=1 Tax=Anopheles funestus TaxID=62324 RepID=UPI0020C7045A|nr:collagenase-like [Anopheles funestus]
MQLKTLFVVICIATVSAVANADASDHLSTNGYLAYSGQFPHHAKLFVTDDKTFRTYGSLITPNYILTLAQWLRAPQIKGIIILGIDDGRSTETQQRFNFTKSDIVLHPTYNIASIRLDRAVTFTKFVQPIRLPRLSDTRTYEMMEGTNVIGFYGATRYLRNQVMVNEVCNPQHPEATIKPEDMCTNAYIGGSLCNRDQGTGLIIQDENGPILVGITSKVYECELNYHTVYLRVSGLRNWITMNTDYVFDF